MKDLIDRHVLLDALKSNPVGKILIDGYNLDGFINDIPSAEPEIIRCMDCKWWEYGGGKAHYGYCHAAKHCVMTRNWEINIRRTYPGDFYCADAEKRENDDE